MLKQQKGMTLTMLVLSIVAVLALAAVAIAMVLDELSYDPEPVQIHTDKKVVSTNDANVETALPETSTPELTETPVIEIQAND